MGHSSKDLFFDVRERAAGESNWTLGKLAKYSISSIASFTSMPLHLISFASMAVFVVSVVMTLIALWQLVQGIAVEGFTTIIILILFTGSIIMFSLGQIGIYLEKIYNEVKSRPSYFIDSNKSLHLEVVENRE
jgi:dolichol-phosphate mannosyltransferase